MYEPPLLTCGVGISTSTDLMPYAYQPPEKCVMAAVAIGGPDEALIWGRPGALRLLAASLIEAAEEAEQIPGWDIPCPSCAAQKARAAEARADTIDPEKEAR